MTPVSTISRRRTRAARTEPRSVGVGQCLAVEEPSVESLTCSPGSVPPEDPDGCVEQAGRDVGDIPVRIEALVGEHGMLGGDLPCCLQGHSSGNCPLAIVVLASVLPGSMLLCSVLVPSEPQGQ